MSMMTFARRGAGMLVVVVGMMIGGSGSGQATFYDGNKLLETCTTVGPEVGLCLGYVAAIADTLQGIRAYGRHETIVGWSACVPDNVTLKQLFDVTLKFLQARPEKRHLSANSLVAAALEGAFPCP